MELNNLEKKAVVLYKCHNELAKRYQIANEVVNISVILVSAVITAFLPILQENGSNVMLANSFLGFYITLMATIAKSYKPGERFQNHKICAENYISLKSKIRQKIIVADADDDRNIQAIQDVIDKFENLRKVSPFVSNNLYDKHMKNLN